MHRRTGLYDFGQLGFLGAARENQCFNVFFLVEEIHIFYFNLKKS